jgi:acyl carrier protein
MPEPNLDAILALLQPLAGAEPLAAESALLSSGRLDSFLLLDLVESLEDSYGFAAQASEVTPENLDTPALILAYVQRKRAQA